MVILELNNMTYTLNQSERKSKKIEPKTILYDINLKVQAGEFHLVTGPSGCGKTTLLQIIATFLSPSSGERILFDEVIPPKAEDEDLYHIRKRIGYLFQTPYIPPNLSVRNYLLLQSSLSKVGVKTSEEQINILLEKIGIEYLFDRQTSILSGGEKQRIALLAIFLKQVDLLLLDEPTGSLDFENSQRIWNLLKLLRQNNITIIAVTHDESIKQLADSVHYLDYGILK